MRHYASAAVIEARTIRQRARHARAKHLHITRRTTLARLVLAEDALSRTKGEQTFMPEGVTFRDVVREFSA